MTVSNPYHEMARVSFVGSPRKGSFIVYLEHPYIWLKANATADVKVEIEYAPASVEDMQRSDYMSKFNDIEIPRLPGGSGMFSLRGIVAHPADQHPQPLDGCDIGMRACLSTRLTGIEITHELITGRVERIFASRALPVNEGWVLLILGPTGRKAEIQKTTIGSVHGEQPGFRFKGLASYKGVPFELVYPPQANYAEAVLHGTIPS
jgi:hypothetical protein